MHPSHAIFRQIEALWSAPATPQTPAFFSLIGDHWEITRVLDLETFYCHIRRACPEATALVSSYSVGPARMLVAHYESAADACHRTWRIEDDGSLTRDSHSPVRSTRTSAVAA